MNNFKKTVTHITSADHSDHIISHVLTEMDRSSEMTLKKDYHRH